MKRNNGISRRRFMGAMAGSAAAFTIVPSHVLGQNPPSSKLNIAAIASGGRARANLNGTKSENIVALCDVDERRAASSFKQFPKAKRYKDFRVMLDKMDKSIEREDNPRHWGDGKPGNEVDGPWQRLFVDCVKEGKKPSIDFEESHRATVCCHLANIAYRVGRQVDWDGASESILGDD